MGMINKALLNTEMLQTKSRAIGRALLLDLRQGWTKNTTLSVSHLHVFDRPLQTSNT